MQNKILPDDYNYNLVKRKKMLRLQKLLQRREYVEELIKKNLKKQRGVFSATTDKPDNPINSGQIQINRPRLALRERNLLLNQDYIPRKNIVNRLQHMKRYGDQRRIPLPFLGEMHYGFRKRKRSDSETEKDDGETKKGDDDSDVGDDDFADFVDPEEITPMNEIGYLTVQYHHKINERYNNETMKLYEESKIDKKQEMDFISPRAYSEMLQNIDERGKRNRRNNPVQILEQPNDSIFSDSLVSEKVRYKIEELNLRQELNSLLDANQELQDTERNFKQEKQYFDDRKFMQNFNINLNEELKQDDLSTYINMQPEPLNLMYPPLNDDYRALTSHNRKRSAHFLDIEHGKDLELIDAEEKKIDAEEKKKDDIPLRYPDETFDQMADRLAKEQEERNKREEFERREAEKRELAIDEEKLNNLAKKNNNSPRKKGFNLGLKDNDDKILSNEEMKRLEEEKKKHK